MSLRFIPSAPLTASKKNITISNQHRLDYAGISDTTESGFSIDPRELNRSGPSYTIDTLREIHSALDSVSLCLLIGMDAWQDFEHWKDWQLIPNFCHIVIMTRPGYRKPKLTPLWKKRLIEHPSELAQHINGKLLFVKIPESGAASSTIRKHLAKGIGVSEHLHTDVAQHIVVITRSINNAVGLVFSRKWLGLAALS